MKHLLLLLLSFNAFAGIPCGNIGGPVHGINLKFTVPFERESNEFMLISEYHEWAGIKVYVNNEQYTLSSFDVVATQPQSIRIWTQCEFNRIKLTLTDADERESVYSQEVIADYTPPKTGMIECTQQM